VNNDNQDMKSKLTVVIPAYNEAETLPILLPPLLAYCIEKKWGIIIINDGSTDKTRTILEPYETQPSIQVIHHKVNKGYGGALKTGISNTKTEFVLTMDADGQHRIVDIDLLLETMHENDADLVVGSRKGLKNVSLYRETGKKIIRFIAKSLMTVPIHDINSGFKLYRTDLAKLYLSLCPNGMSFSDIITLTFINQMHKVVEVNIQVNKRIAGKSSITTTTALETGQEIINMIMLFHPLKIFFPLSLSVIMVGVLWGIPFAYLGRGVSVGSMLAIVTGLLLLFMGLVAEQISHVQQSIIELRRENILSKHE
jgi:glycosyltransferase involved in cell wall biosynthesis